jgi:hypothetical protein
MVYAPPPRGEDRGKLIHSNACFFIVPAGLCAAAVLIHWAMTLF